MANAIERYYYFHEASNTIFYDETMLDPIPELIFIGSSMNPNVKMAAATFTQNFDIQEGYKVKEYQDGSIPLM